jgi:catechol 2,3-dioxygenase-like lactoylglutathione lyase family enzyme
LRRATATPFDAEELDMLAKRLTPILNVSDIQQSFTWFEKLGWTKGWDWGAPPSFGGVCSGDCEIFLCENGQGGRGQGGSRTTFGPESDEAAEKGVWMSIWVDDVDAVHKRCVENGLEVTWPPTNMPWNVREMHVRHPDGHVFRVSQGTADAHE